ncbi:MAG: zinc ribbon domain-containing protein [Acidobacteriota bacterium]
MYCPQCGQQQVSDVVRYCSRCGFLLDGVSAVVARGGAVPTQYVPQGYRQLSPRSKGVRQGALLMLSTVLIVPLVGIIGVAILGLPGEIAGIAAVTCMLGGLLRIFYALLMEDAVAPNNPEAMAGYGQAVTPQFARPVQNPALPPASANAPAWRPRLNTAELYQPPSVTENTTRLLNKDEKKDD